MYADISSFLATGGGVAVAMEEHYKTFITEADIAQMAGAGAFWVLLTFVQFLDRASLICRSQLHPSSDWVLGRRNVAR